MGRRFYRQLYRLRTDISGGGALSVSITQTGSVLSGSLSATNTDCGDISNVSLTGSVSGSTASFSGSYLCQMYSSNNELRFTNGALSGNTINGAYAIYTNGSFYSSGSFTLTRPNTIYSLTVTKSGTGTGTVTSSPSGIDCGSTCSSSYSSGTQVTLSASPASGSTFGGWSGGGCSGDGSCIVTISAATTVTATFDAQPSCTYSLSPAFKVFTIDGGTDSIAVIPSMDSCAWTANTPNSWITITSGNNGTGSGTINYSVSSNGDTQRMGMINVGGQPFMVTQTGKTSRTIVAAGEDHAMSLKPDGTVWAWGYNYYGQLGDGTTTNRSTPVQVSGLTNVIAIAAGGSFSVALKSDGTVWA